jgi:hypothetical protein
MSPDEAMKPSCDFCNECYPGRRFVVVDGARFFWMVCYQCIARIELERESLKTLSPAESEDIERAIFDARRALGDQSFADKLPAIPDRGFVTIRFSTECGVLSKAGAAE